MEVGKTPIVKLSDRLYGKLEAVNPGGSIKDRPVKYILDDAENRGILNLDDTIIETNYISSDMVSKIRSEIEWCQTKIGVEKYTNAKRQTYSWPTMICFMRKK